MTVVAYLLLGAAALAVLAVAVVGFLWLLQFVLNEHDAATDQADRRESQQVERRDPVRTKRVR